MNYSQQFVEILKHLVLMMKPYWRVGFIHFFVTSFMRQNHVGLRSFSHLVLIGESRVSNYASSAKQIDLGYYSICHEDALL